MQGGSDASLFFGNGVREHTEILKMDFGFGSSPGKNVEMRVSFQPAYYFSSVRESALEAEIYATLVRNLTSRCAPSILHHDYVMPRMSL
jgi:hypothetical protein